jgi:hypothetical protein
MLENCNILRPKMKGFCINNTLMNLADITKRDGVVKCQEAQEARF